MVHNNADRNVACVLQACQVTVSYRQPISKQASAVISLQPCRHTSLPPAYISSSEMPSNRKAYTQDPQHADIPSYIPTKIKKRQKRQNINANFDYRQLHEGRFHSTGIGLFHFFAPDDHTPPLAGAVEHSETGGSRADTVKTTPSQLSVDSPASGRKIQRPLVVQEPRRWWFKSRGAGG